MMRPTAIAAFLLPAVLAAQAKTSPVIVTDSLGNRVAFAWVQPRNSSAARAADDSGRVTVDLPPADSIGLMVRRMGYKPFEGKVGLDAGLGAYRVMLEPLPQAVERISIVAPQENRLFRNGFYTRMADVQKIATPARFFSPEALDARPANRTTQYLEGIPFVTARRYFGKTVLQGRGRCAVNFLLDGKRPLGLVDDFASREGETELARIVRSLPPGMDPEIKANEALRTYFQGRQSIDELISPGTIAAIEVYASANQAPVELRNAAAEPNCAVVAVWTGPRQ